MEISLDCNWCEGTDLDVRTIRQTKFIRSFVSKPWFREGHCLVIPNRHIASVHEMDNDEASGLMIELGRLGVLLDAGFGTGIMQKFMPRKEQDNIKMNHLHFHVFPRQENEEGLFPTPYPNDFSAFYQPDQDEVLALVRKLKG